MDTKENIDGMSFIDEIIKELNLEQNRISVLQLKVAFKADKYKLRFNHSKERWERNVADRA